MGQSTRPVTTTEDMAYVHASCGLLVNLWPDREWWNTLVPFCWLLLFVATELGLILFLDGWAMGAVPDLKVADSTRRRSSEPLMFDRVALLDAVVQGG